MPITLLLVLAASDPSVLDYVRLQVVGSIVILIEARSIEVCTVLLDYNNIISIAKK